MTTITTSARADATSSATPSDSCTTATAQLACEPAGASAPAGSGAAGATEPSESGSLTEALRKLQVEDPLLEEAFDMAPESDDGNCEYKRHLVHPSKDRMEHLTTQMAYRLTEGMGEALYVVGVDDDGAARGISREDLDASIATIETLAERILAEEHRIYPAAIGIMLDGAWRIEGRRFLRR